MEQHSSAEIKTSLLNSLVVKCAAMLITIILVMSAAFSYIADDSVESLATSLVSAKIKVVATQSAQNLAAAGGDLNQTAIQDEITAASTAFGKNGSGMIVTDASGAILAQQGLANQQIANVQAVALESVQTKSPLQSLEFKTQAQPISNGDTIVGAVAIVWTEEAALASVADSRFFNKIIAAIVLFTMMGGAIAFLHFFMGKPFAKITERVVGISDGDYDTVIEITNDKDEIGVLGHHLNILLGRLRTARAEEAEKLKHMDVQLHVVERLGAGLDDLAEGVLHHEIEEEFPENYELLRRNYNKAVVGLRTVLTKVNDSSGSILANADEIATASNEMSTRTETQAATLEQSAAALEQILATVKLAATEAQDAETAVRSTQEIARHNGDIMKAAVAAMGEIENSSAKINDISSVIDDIAFQTNLLALNAGVEAARAGPSGKGFAVVAIEVQGLAHRSALAAQQIKDLIISSGDHVQTGVELVQRAECALEEVVSNVGGISKMTEGFALRAADQAESLSELNTGVTNLDQVTQKNAAMVEQSTAAALVLRKGATGLRGMVQTFELTNPKATQRPGQTGVRTAA